MIHDMERINLFPFSQRKSITKIEISNDTERRGEKKREFNHRQIE